MIPATVQLPCPACDFANTVEQSFVRTHCIRCGVRISRPREFYPKAARRRIGMSVANAVAQTLCQGAIR